MVYCLQYLCCKEEAYYCGRVLEAIGASIERNDSHIDRSMDASESTITTDLLLSSAH
jgi:hypothetical protein